MLILADTHVHIYPFYDMAAAIRLITRNLGAHAGESEHVKVACLAESAGCNWFSGIKEGSVTVPDGYVVEKSGFDENAFMITGEGAVRLYIVAGRQIVTGERLEVVALTKDVSISSGYSVDDVVRQVLEAGAVPVLSWAFGKWLFGRAKTVRERITNADPGRLLIGDTAMRPASRREPALMRLARERGLTVICGSDPLPFPGEEKYMGTYCTLLNGEFDPVRPAESIRTILMSDQPASRCMGKRCRLTDACRRFVRQKI